MNNVSYKGINKNIKKYPILINPYIFFIKQIKVYYQLILCDLIFPTTKGLKTSFRKNVVNFKYKKRSFTDPSNKINYPIHG